MTGKKDDGYEDELGREKDIEDQHEEDIKRQEEDREKRRKIAEKENIRPGEL